MKRYLYMSQREYNKYENALKPFWDVIYMQTLDSDPLYTSNIKQIIDYDGFSACIKYNRLTELWDLPYSKAVNLITENQTKYLRTPLYVIYNNDEIYHMETGIEDFQARFVKEKEDN